MEFNTSTVYRGFAWKYSQPVAGIHAVLHRFEHVSSGADLVWLEREDTNKSFAIAFKTIPENSTGVFHILEHSVLCGSEKYPVREPFLELMKGSLNTFLNALTFPDKTAYPVASRNNKDFLNLVDVYMDAVLHPAIYTNPNIFRQEGWHYELETKDAVPTYKGVVFNEMKGAFASVDRLFNEELTARLLPDTCYSYCSGGDPKIIPTLTYEQFLNAHRRFYHPGNSRIFLDGSIQFDETFEKLDSFLKDYTRQEPHTDIPMQKPVASATYTIPYEISEEEDPCDKTHICFGRIAGNYSDKEEMVALKMLTTTLAGTNESPLKRAVLDKGLGQEVELSVDTEMQQAILSLVIRNTSKEKLEEIRETLKDVLTKLANGALDHEDLEASLNNLEYQTREHDFGSFPAGLVYCMNAYGTWLYGGDPAQNLDYDDCFKSIRSKLKTDYFENLIQKHFLTDQNLVTLITVPSKTLGAENAKEEQDRLTDAKNSWNENDIQGILDMNATLQHWQATPDTPEQLATIPQLTLEDIEKKPAQYPVTSVTCQGIPVLSHDIRTEGIAYLHLYFNASDIPAEQLPVLSSLTDIFSQLDTEHYTSLQLQKKIRSDLGNLNLSTMVLNNPPDTASCRVLLDLECDVLASKFDSAVGLIDEILNHTLFSSGQSDKIRSIIQQSKMSMEQNTVMRGHSYASMRRKANSTAAGVASEMLNGYSCYSWLKDTISHLDDNIDSLRESYRSLASKIFSRSRMTVSITGPVSEAEIKKLCDIVPDTETGSADVAHYQPFGNRQEGIRIPAAVGFSSIGGNLYQNGYQYNGHMMVASKVMSLGYLWGAVRVQGGAYGTNAQVARNGDVNIWSYRDPTPGKTIGTDKGAIDFLRALAQSGEDLTPMIVGTISDMDPLETPRTAAEKSDTLYLTGVTYEDRCRLREEVLSTKASDLGHMADALEKILSGNSLCIIGGADTLNACKEYGLSLEELSL